MTTAEALLERNAAFSARGFTPDLPVLPRLKTVLVTCADQRVDPAHVLGLDLGEVAVLRNPGGRITPAILQEVAMLAVVAAEEGATGGFELIVLHHTDCGMTRLARHPDLLSAYFGIERDELASKAVSDPEQSVVSDIEALRASPMLPSSLIVAGLVYHVETGGVTTVVAPGALRDE